MLVDFGVKIMELETCVRSIFDSYKGGSMSTEGYMHIFFDVNNNEEYAMSSETYNNLLKCGRKLSGRETASFFGEKVRAMSTQEEHLWDEGTLPDSNVDLWGNVKVQEESEEISEDYYNTLKQYYQFAHKFSEYVLYNANATIDDFRFWKNLQNWVNVEDIDVSADNKVCFITWLKEDWGYWLKNILTTGEPVLNITDAIWKSWERF